MQLKEGGENTPAGVIGGLFSFVDYYFDFKGFAARYAGCNDAILRATQGIFKRFCKGPRTSSVSRRVR